MSSIDSQKNVFSYSRSADLDAAKALRYPVVVVGAGPIGLSLAIDLAQQGLAVVLLDNDDRLSTGSRAICFAKRTLEVFDRLGCGDRMIEKGVSWNVGQVFFQDEMVSRFDLLPKQGHERPAFINLQQYYVEGFLVQRAQEGPTSGPMGQRCNRRHGREVRLVSAGRAVVLPTEWASTCARTGWRAPAGWRPGGPDAARGGPETSRLRGAAVDVVLQGLEPAWVLARAAVRFPGGR